MARFGCAKQLLVVSEAITKMTLRGLSRTCASTRSLFPEVVRAKSVRWRQPIVLLSFFRDSPDGLLSRAPPGPGESH